jgi:hypothetical protein
MGIFLLFKENKDAYFLLTIHRLDRVRYRKIDTKNFWRINEYIIKRKNKAARYAV